MTKFILKTGRFDYADIEYEGTIEEFVEELSTTKWWITDDDIAIQVCQIHSVRQE